MVSRTQKEDLVSIISPYNRKIFYSDALLEIDYLQNYRQSLGIWSNLSKNIKSSCKFPQKDWIS